MKTSEKIIKYLKEREHATGAELSDFLQITDRAVRKQIKSLLEKGSIKKQGTPPKVFYSIKENPIASRDVKINLDFETEKIISENFFLISPVGRRMEGLEAFIDWTEKRGFDLNGKAKEYVDVYKKYQKYFKNGLISGKYKMKETFDDVFLDEVYYLDFYSIEVFGKTKLGQMMLYAKQSQDKKLIRELIVEIKPRVEKLIRDKKIDAVGFIPPSIKREVQFIKEIEKGLNLGLSKIDLVKVSGDVVVAQKTLNKLSDRIENSKQIKFLTGGYIKKYKHILLIDDALGSGATLNEVARQIKTQMKSVKVIGLAITGSFSGFEVISEV